MKKCIIIYLSKIDEILYEIDANEFGYTNYYTCKEYIYLTFGILIWIIKSKKVFKIVIRILLKEYEYLKNIT